MKKEIYNPKCLKNYLNRGYQLSRIVTSIQHQDQIEKKYQKKSLKGILALRVAKEMLRSGRKPKDKAEKMVKNNYVTINYMKDIINELNS